VVALCLSVSLVVLVGTLRWFGAVAFVAFAGWLATVWILAIPAMVFEQAGVFAALRRSRGLVKDRFWSAFLIWFLTALLAFVLLFVIGLVLGAVLGKGSSDATSTGIASVVMTSVAVIAMTPAFTAILAVLYFDQRVRREGFDLRLMARELGESEPAETPEPEPEPAAPAAEWQPPRPPEYPPRGGL
jgi:hypothetical protein